MGSPFKERSNEAAHAAPTVRSLYTLEQKGSHSLSFPAVQTEFRNVDQNLMVDRPEAEGDPMAPQATLPRKILLVDCDMFYVQVARLEDPEGLAQEELLIVGGSPTGRGVVTSASYAVRAFGVRSGMPTSQALRLCPSARVVGVSRKACSARSKEVRRVLDRLSPVVQAASIDEFYLDLSGTERLLHHEALTTTAGKIRMAVLDETGISVSVGGGTRKLIAKLAAGRAKPGGVWVVPPGEEADFMKEFRLPDIPGVGPSLAQALERKGLVQVPDLLAIEREWLDRWFGTARGGWLWRRARGLDDAPVLAREPRKSISSERTFSSDLSDSESLEREVLRLVGTVGRGLRREGLSGRTVTVKIRDGDFRTRQASHTVPDPVASDGTLYILARGLFRDLRSRRMTAVRLLGVAVSGLVAEDGPPQLDLFRNEADGGGAEEGGRPWLEDRLWDEDRFRVVSRVLDDLRDRFGSDAIFPGGLLGPPQAGREEK